jgi:hypothetical protein
MTEFPQAFLPAVLIGVIVGCMFAKLGSGIVAWVSSILVLCAFWTAYVLYQQDLESVRGDWLWVINETSIVKLILKALFFFTGLLVTVMLQFYGNLVAFFFGLLPGVVAVAITALLREAFSIVWNDMRRMMFTPRRC